MMKRIKLAALLLSIAWTANCQVRNQLTIRPGDRVADSVFRYILEKSGRASNPPALFILDFWATSCTSCIAAFPKVDSLQKQFGTSVQFVLVNSHENQNKIDRHFELMNGRRNERNLPPHRIPNVPAIAGDGYLKDVFPHRTVPHHVWLSGEGEVLAITEDGNTNFKNIRAYLDGQQIHMRTKKDFTGMDTNLPLFLSPDLNRDQIEHFSLLVKGHAGYFRHPTALDSTRHFSMNKPLRTLYESLGSRLVPRLRHGRLIIEGAVETLDDQTYYTYDFIVPNKLSDSLYHYALADLNRYTPVYGRVEKRRMPVFVLKLSGDTQALETKGQATKNTLFLREGRSGQRQALINRPWKDFVSWVSIMARKDGSERVLVDETGIVGNIDIEFDSIVDDYQTLRWQLKRYGLDIIKAERAVEVFVLSDKKTD